MPSPSLLPGPQRTFTGAQLSEIAFPIGGIGAGTVALGGRGNLRDFELQNHPDKGNNPRFTGFALWCRPRGGTPIARLLESSLQPPFREPGGEPPNLLAGLPRFAEASFRGEYPFGYLELKDPQVPLQVELTAWNPFIPLDVRHSALPLAAFEWTFTNTSAAPLEISLAAFISNNLTGPNPEGTQKQAGAINEARQSGSVRGVYLHHSTAPAGAPETGTMSLSTTWNHTHIVSQWYRGGWFDKAHLFWDEFSKSGLVPEFGYFDPAPHEGDVSSLTLHATLAPGEKITLPVTLTWHFPVRKNPWPGDLATAPASLETYQGAHFSDAWAVAEYFATHRETLRAQTTLWHQALFSSTLPPAVLEAISSQASIIRSSTCFLLADGNFFAWEGTWHQDGSCHGSCTHVWNYEQTLAFLFPELERTMRRTEFLHNTRPSGNTAFRTNLPPGSSLWNFKPAADGQMGTIIQLYRDWQLSGDDDFLREVWPGAQRALEYAWTMTPEQCAPASTVAINTPGAEPYSIDSLWDPDKDGLMEGEQHNTYDIEFFGPNTMCTAMYLAALRAGSEIAAYLGDEAKAEEYRSIYESGRRKVDELLWNGEYYIQKVHVIPEVTVPQALRSPRKPSDDPSEPPTPKYQYGNGCLSDQLLGQWAAHVAGLGYLLDKDRVATALHSIFKYNFRPALGAQANVHRAYGLNEEAGLLVCSWPHGDRPALPTVYSDEVWTGMEFHVAAHLIYEGHLEAGLTLVEAVAARYSGHNRNPWNHIECGFHYARALSSWSVKLALDGFRFSVPQGSLGFSPQLHQDDYRTFWSTGTAWGTYSQNLSSGQFELQVLYGQLTLRQLSLSDLPAGELHGKIPAGPVQLVRLGSTLNFDPIQLNSGEKFSIEVNPG